MCYKWFIRKIKSGYTAFCEETSMHGFLELHRAKHWVWKIVWLVLLIASFALTGFQLCKSIDQYMHQTASVTLIPATEDDMIYPPILYCPLHFIQWIDFHRLEESLADNTLVYVFSIFNNFETSSDFNMTVADRNLTRYFIKRQHDGNYTLADFFIEHSKYLGSEHDDIDDITQKELISVGNKTRLCYTLNETVIKSRLDSNHHFTFSVHKQSTKKYTYYRLPEFRMFFTKADIRDFGLFFFKEDSIERSMISSAYENESLDPIDLLEFIENNTLSLGSVFVDGYNYQELIPDKKVSGYVIQLKSSIQKLLPGDNVKCKKDQKCVFRKEFGVCKEKCTKLSYSFSKFDSNSNKTLSTPCKELNSLLALGETPTLRNTCRNPSFGAALYGDEMPLEIEILGDFDETFYQKCLAECTEGCNRYKWELFYSPVKFMDTVSSNYDVEFTVQYSTPESVQILQEIDTKSWEDFVGNVGGLLGIWTGASILSLFQLFYLFCCPPEDISSTNVEIQKMDNTQNVKKPSITKSAATTTTVINIEDEPIFTSKQQENDFKFNRLKKIEQKKV